MARGESYLQGIRKNIYGGVRNSVVASQPCPSGHITAGKRLRYASLKLPSATSFIRQPLAEMLIGNT